MSIDVCGIQAAIGTQARVLDQADREAFAKAIEPIADEASDNGEVQAAIDQLIADNALESMIEHACQDLDERTFHQFTIGLAENTNHETHMMLAQMVAGNQYLNGRPKNQAMKLRDDLYQSLLNSERKAPKGQASELETEIEDSFKKWQFSTDTGVKFPTRALAMGIPSGNRGHCVNHFAEAQMHRSQRGDGNTSPPVVSTPPPQMPVVAQNASPAKDAQGGKADNAVKADKTGQGDKADKSDKSDKSGKGNATASSSTAQAPTRSQPAPVVEQKKAEIKPAAAGKRQWSDTELKDIRAAKALIATRKELPDVRNADGTWTHYVREGETLSQIAEDWGGRWTVPQELAGKVDNAQPKTHSDRMKTLAQLHGINFAAARFLQIGTKLTIPYNGSESPNDYALDASVSTKVAAPTDIKIAKQAVREQPEPAAVASRPPQRPQPSKVQTPSRITPQQETDNLVDELVKNETPDAPPPPPAVTPAVTPQRKPQQATVATRSPAQGAKGGIYHPTAGAAASDILARMTPPAGAAGTRLYDSFQPPSTPRGSGANAVMAAIPSTQPAPDSDKADKPGSGAKSVVNNIL